MHSFPQPLPVFPSVVGHRETFDHLRGDRRQERWWQDSQAELGLRMIEERWKKISCNSLCYVARMEDQDEEDGVGGGRRRKRSSVSLSPLSRWV